MKILRRRRLLFCSCYSNGSCCHHIYPTKGQRRSSTILGNDSAQLDQKDYCKGLVCLKTARVLAQCLSHKTTSSCATNRIRHTSSEASIPHSDATMNLRNLHLDRAWAVSVWAAEKHTYDKSMIFVDVPTHVIPFGACRRGYLGVDATHLEASA